MSINSHLKNIYKMSFIIAIITLSSVLLSIVLTIAGVAIYNKALQTGYPYTEFVQLYIASIVIAVISLVINMLFAIFIIPTIISFDYKNEKMEKSSYYIATIALVVSFICFFAVAIFYMIWSKKMLSILSSLESKNTDVKQIEQN